MSDLVEFLRARYDEDAEVAQATRKNEQFVYGTDRWFASHNNAITSMAPHRAVAEVDAKRRIVADHEGIMHGYREICPRCGNPPGYDYEWQDAPCPTLRLLALPYADHPDYRQEWRP